MLTLSMHSSDSNFTAPDYLQQMHSMVQGNASCPKAQLHPTGCWAQSHSTPLALSQQGAGCLEICIAAFSRKAAGLTLAVPLAILPLPIVPLAIVILSILLQSPPCMVPLDA